MPRFDTSDQTNDDYEKELDSLPIMELFRLMSSRQPGSHNVHFGSLKRSSHKRTVITVLVGVQDAKVLVTRSEIFPLFQDLLFEDGSKSVLDPLCTLGPFAVLNSSTCNAVKKQFTGAETLNLVINLQGMDLSSIESTMRNMTSLGTFKFLSIWLRANVNVASRSFEGRLIPYISGRDLDRFAFTLGTTFQTNNIRILKIDIQEMFSFENMEIPTTTDLILRENNQFLRLPESLFRRSENLKEIHFISNTFEIWNTLVNYCSFNPSISIIKTNQIGTTEAWLDLHDDFVIKFEKISVVLFEPQTIDSFDRMIRKYVNLTELSITLQDDSLNLQNIINSIANYGTPLLSNLRVFVTHGSIFETLDERLLPCQLVSLSLVVDTMHHHNEVAFPDAISETFPNLEAFALVIKDCQSCAECGLQNIVNCVFTNVISKINQCPMLRYWQVIIDPIGKRYSNM